jgi:hypothetical protein
MIILGSQVPINPTEYLYILPGCVLGHHYKAFHCLLLVCSVHTAVSPEVSVQITKPPPLVLCGSQKSPLIFPLVPNQMEL